MPKKKKEKKVIKIEIELSKLIKIIIITLGIMALLITCFLISNIKTQDYTDYNENSTSSEENQKDEEDALDKAIKESESISENERKKPEEISVNDYLELYKSEQKSLILLAKEECSYCKIALPIIENIIYESNVDIKYIDTSKMSDEDVANLVRSDDYFKEGYGTPTLFIVSSSKLVDVIDGVTTKENYQKFMKNYGFME